MSTSAEEVSINQELDLIQEESMIKAIQPILYKPSKSLNAMESCSFMSVWEGVFLFSGSKKKWEVPSISEKEAKVMKKVYFESTTYVSNINTKAK